MRILEVIDPSTVNQWGQDQAQQLGLVRFELGMNSQGDIELEYLQVAQRNQGQNRGSAAMRRLCVYADQWNKRIVLTPSEKNTATGTTSRTRLIKFYQQFGFKLNRGSQRDFTTRAAMIREPDK
jgi:GNAT superfamily N-acetyltransferase